MTKDEAQNLIKYLKHQLEEQRRMTAMVLEASVLSTSYCSHHTGSVMS